VKKRTERFQIHAEPTGEKYQRRFAVSVINRGQQKCAQRVKLKRKNFTTTNFIALAPVMRSTNFNDALTNENPDAATSTVDFSVRFWCRRRQGAETGFASPEANSRG
jgi:hypothetical protein